MYTHIYTHMYVYTQTHTYVQIYICVCVCVLSIIKKSFILYRIILLNKQFLYCFLEIHGIIYIYIYIYYHYHLVVMTLARIYIPDTLSLLLPIVLCFWQVLRATSRILTELLYVGSSWSPCFCLAM